MTFPSVLRFAVILGVLNLFGNGHVESPEAIVAAFEPLAAVDEDVERKRRFAELARAAAPAPRRPASYA
jgi:hypothetical protein